MYVKKRKEQFNKKNNIQEERERKYFKIQASNSVRQWVQLYSRIIPKFHFQILLTF